MRVSNACARYMFQMAAAIDTVPGLIRTISQQPFQSNDMKRISAMTQHLSLSLSLSLYVYNIYDGCQIFMSREVHLNAACGIPCGNLAGPCGNPSATTQPQYTMTQNGPRGATKNAIPHHGACTHSAHAQRARGWGKHLASKGWAARFVFAEGMGWVVFACGTLAGTLRDFRGDFLYHSLGASPVPFVSLDHTSSVACGIACGNLAGPCGNPHETTHFQQRKYESTRWVLHRGFLAPVIYIYIYIQDILPFRKP